MAAFEVDSDGYCVCACGASSFMVKMLPGVLGAEGLSCSVCFTEYPRDEIVLAAVASRPVVAGYRVYKRRR